MYLLYNLLLYLAAAALLPFFIGRMILTGKYRHSLGRKLGFIEATGGSLDESNPRVWFHAVSVGEVGAVQPIIEELRLLLPRVEIVLSTSTETGQAVARRIKTIDKLIYYPLDFPPVINKVLNIVKPDLFVTAETELWPNFSRICAFRGIAMLMVNGRLSPRSFSRYQKTRFFWRRIIGNYEAIGVISERHAGRFRQLGMPEEKIFVLGNAKYDSLAEAAQGGPDPKLARELGIGDEEPVLVAGSTHEGEEEKIIASYRELLPEYPRLRLILAPRHIDRVGRVKERLEAAGFADAATLSEVREGRLPAGRVILVDTIGELFKIYGLANLVFCGGSLVPKGGQNILEPAAWGKVVFFGPFMDDFSDEATALEAAGGAFRIRDNTELTAGISRFLADPELCRELGRLGQEVVKANRGTAARYAAMIKTHLSSPRRACSKADRNSDS